MRRAGLRGLSGRPKWRNTASIAAAADLVDRDFARDEPDRLCAADIAEYPTREGKGLLRGGAGAPSAAELWAGRSTRVPRPPWRPTRWAWRSAIAAQSPARL